MTAFVKTAAGQSGEAENHNNRVGNINLNKFWLFALKSTFIMKKVKIMLLSLAILAVVGGALAFKARQVTKFCTAVFQSNNCNRKCDVLITSTTTASGGNIWCTTVPAQIEDPANPGQFISTCTVNGVKLDCNTTTRITDDF